MSLKLNSSGGGSVTLQEPVTASDLTVNLPNNSGTMLTTASTFGSTGPAFSAYGSAATTLSTGTYTKILFQTEEYDTNNNFASSRFTPTVAGYYQLSWGVDLEFSFTGRLFSLVYKNNVLIYYASPNLGGVTQFGSSGTAMFNANGTTDYFEVYCYQDSGVSRNTSFRTVYNNIGTYFQGVLVRAA